jgi:probable F420-dependent oxidoreductase
MKLGLFPINSGMLGGDPDAAVTVAIAAEAAGWESVWTGEHFALPEPAVRESPVPGATPMLEPFIALANIAAHTSTLLLGTGVTVLPLYNPYALAKQVVSLDRVSAGRVLFGVGVGYLAPEFSAFDVPLATRGRAVDEMLDSLHAIWTEQVPAIRWRGKQITGLRSEPRPLAPDGPPIHVGGYGPAAFRRAHARGAGWYGWALTPDGVRAALGELAAATQGVERPSSLGPLEISISPPWDMTVDQASIEEYRELGVDRLIPLVPTGAAREVAAIVDFVERTAESSAGRTEATLIEPGPS